MIGVSTRAVPCRIASFFGSKRRSLMASCFLRIASSTINRIITQQVAIKN